MCFSDNSNSISLLWFWKEAKNLKMERSLALFGCCTGSTGSGLVAFRLLDPNFSTSVSRELVYFNALIIIFLSMHILMFIAPLTPSIDLMYFFAIYLLTCVVGFFDSFFPFTPHLIPSTC